MTILGIEQITYGVTDLETCRRFFADWGLTETSHDETRARFETLNGCTVLVADANDATLPAAFEAGPTLREVTWGVATREELDALRERLKGQPGYYSEPEAVGCFDPAGMAIRVEVTRRREIDLKGSPSNVWGQTLRVDTPSPIYERARPVEVGHVVFFTNCLAEQEQFYHELLASRRRTAIRIVARSCAARRTAATTTCSCSRCPTARRASITWRSRCGHPRGVWRRPAYQPLRLDHTAWPWPASGFLGVLLVLQEPGGRADRVLRRRRRAHAGMAAA